MRFDDLEPLTVVLVRHGETALTRTKAMSGGSVPGPGLSSTGRIQAARAADLVFRIGRASYADLPHPTALHASPLVRTQETAAAVGRRLGLPVLSAPAFAEADFGAWEGRTVDDIEAREPGAVRDWYVDPGKRAPGGESLLEVGTRVGEALSALLQEGTGRTVVVVSHAMAIRAALGVSLDLPAERWQAVRVVVGSVSIVRWWPDGAREVVVVGLPGQV